MLSVNIPRAPCSTPAPSSPVNQSINQSFTPRSIFNTSNVNEVIDSTPSTPINQSINQSANVTSPSRFSFDTPSSAGFQIYEQSLYSTPFSHGDGSSWAQDKDDLAINQSINQSLEKTYDSPKGFHVRGAAKLRLQEIENKEQPIDIIETKKSNNQSNDQSKELINQYVQKSFDFFTEPSSLTQDNERLLHLLCCMFRCRECLPTPADMEEEANGQSNYHFSSRKLGEFCCVGNALSSSWPSCLPYDLISLTQSYTLTQPTRSFLTRPAPASAGVIQCFILKDKATKKFELFMEMRDNSEFVQLKKDMQENDISEEELRAKLFRNRLKRGLKTPSNNQSSINQSMNPSQLDADSLAANSRSMLVNHARSLVEAGQDISLMTAQRRRAWTGNSYTIAMNQSVDQSTNSNFLGKLKSNFGGTEFMLYEHGVRKCSSPDQSAKQSINQSIKQSLSGGHKSVLPISASPHARYSREAGMIQYDHFFEHTGSPIRIKVALPNCSFHAENQSINPSINQSIPSSPCLSKQWKLEQQAALDRALATGQPLPDLQAAATPRSQAAESKASKVPASTLCCDEFQEFSYQTKNQQVEQFENLRPVWHDGMNAYVLHFDHHRVREKSVKNFKLVRTLDGERKTVLQFGRVLGDRNVFVMDFSYPLSPFQAFAIALSSLDPKIAV